MRMRIGAQFLIPSGNDSDKNNLTSGCKFQKDCSRLCVWGLVVIAVRLKADGLSFLQDLLRYIQISIESENRMEIKKSGSFAVSDWKKV